MKKNFIFHVQYETTRTLGAANYETEAEMYLMLEQDGITEDNDDVIGISYYEFTCATETAMGQLVRSWDFGKPYTFR